ncbi:MAG: hypothetical protein NTX40_11045 [Planctomycetota bacterium]|nr:hypothetical protein [Planctomycetota bacterium]
MRRIVLLVAAMVVVAPAGFARAQGSGLEDLYGKTTIGESDRQLIRAWLAPRVAALTASTDPELKRMVAARQEIVAAGRVDPTRSAAFAQAFGEEAIAALEAIGKQALSQEARVNYLMTVAELRRIEGIPVLLKALRTDQYAASRYWAAEGLDLVSVVVVERVLPRLEEEIAAGANKAFDTETNGLTLMYLFTALGRFDHETAHDALASGAAGVSMRLKASDPMVARALVDAVRSLQGAYASDVRPEGKTRVLGALAVLCAWVMPPVGDPNLMPALNASLEKITNEQVGFSAGLDPVMQKVALVEWIEWLVGHKQIAKRPSLPPAVEKAVESAKRRRSVSPAPAEGVAPKP